MSRRYRITPSAGVDADAVASALHDRMTECVYASPLESFGTHSAPEKWGEIDVLGAGTPALQAASDEMGLAFDAADLKVSSVCTHVPAPRTHSHFMRASLQFTTLLPSTRTNTQDFRTRVDNT